MKAPVITLDNTKILDVELNDSIFGIKPRKDIMQRVVEWQRAKKQAGTHSSRTITQISGTTKKPYAQKGTGNARQGSLRSPQMRGGACVFGPKPRSHAYDLPKAIRKLGLKSALSLKASEGKVHVVDTLAVKNLKTKELGKKCEKMGLKAALFVRGDNAKDAFAKAVGNLPRMDVIPDIGLNVYDILRHEDLVITTHALKNLEARLA